MKIKHVLIGLGLLCVWLIGGQGISNARPPATTASKVPAKKLSGDTSFKKATVKPMSPEMKKQMINDFLRHQHDENQSQPERIAREMEFSKNEQLFPDQSRAPEFSGQMRAVAVSDGLVAVLTPNDLTDHPVSDHIIFVVMNLYEGRISGSDTLIAQAQENALSFNAGVVQENPIISNVAICVEENWYGSADYHWEIDIEPIAAEIDANEGIQIFMNNLFSPTVTPTVIGEVSGPSTGTLTLVSDQFTVTRNYGDHYCGAENSVFQIRALTGTFAKFKKIRLYHD